MIVKTLQRHLCGGHGTVCIVWDKGVLEKVAHFGKRVVGLSDDLLLPLVLDVVEGVLDLSEVVTRRQDALQPLDVDVFGVFQAGLLLHNAELLDFCAAETQALDSVDR